MDKEKRTKDGLS